MVLKRCGCHLPSPLGESAVIQRATGEWTDPGNQLHEIDAFLFVRVFYCKGQNLNPTRLNRIEISVRNGEGEGVTL